MTLTGTPFSFKARAYYRFEQYGSLHHMVFSLKGNAALKLKIKILLAVRLKLGREDLEHLKEKLLVFLPANMKYKFVMPGFLKY
jgi:hypothetical protein